MKVKKECVLVPFLVLSFSMWTASYAANEYKSAQSIIDESTSIFRADRPTAVFHHSLAYNYDPAVIAKFNNETVLVSNENGKLKYSHNGGANWTPVTGGAQPNHLSCARGFKADEKGHLYDVHINSVKYIKDTKLFVAVGYYFPADSTIEKPPSFSGGLFCSSSDGVNWTAQTLTDDNKDKSQLRSLNDIAYGTTKTDKTGYYLAVGQLGSGALIMAANADHIKTPSNNQSNDSPTSGWHQIHRDATHSVVHADHAGEAVNSVIFINDPESGEYNHQFTTAANKSTIYTFTPPAQKTGKDWIWGDVEDLDGEANFNQIIYAKDTYTTMNGAVNNMKQLIAIADSSTLWQYSFENKEWVQNRDVNGSANFNQIIYDYKKHQFLIAATNSTIWRSATGDVWTKADGLSGHANFDLITYSYSDKLYKAVGSGSEWFSASGMAWSPDSSAIRIYNGGAYDVDICVDKESYPDNSPRIPWPQNDKCFSTTHAGETLLLGKNVQSSGLLLSERICVHVDGNGYKNYIFKLIDNPSSYVGETVIMTGGNAFSPSITYYNQKLLKLMENEGYEFCWGD